MKKTASQLCLENCCLAIGDIDDFKRINDTYGHLCGDAILKQLAEHMRTRLDPAIFICRWGGEEFVFLFHDIREQDALQQLQDCYALNYHPASMILVGVSKEDPKKLLALIKENQKKKTFAPISSVKRLAYTEPKQPARESFSFTMDVSVPKLSYACKLQGIEDVYARTKAEWCIKIMLDAVFSSLNPDFQQWLDEGIINDYVGSEVDLGKDYGMVMFYAETTKKEAFLAIVKEVLARISSADITQELLDQLKNRYFGQSVRSLNSFDDIAITYVRSYFDQADFFRLLDVLYEITLEDIQRVCAALKEAPGTLVELLPENCS